jgi:hypothetical protein
MVMSFAFTVFQVKAVDRPYRIKFGFAARIAGGGAGGGVTLARCLLHAAKKNVLQGAAIRENILNFPRIMLSSICD